MILSLNETWRVSRELASVGSAISRAILATISQSHCSQQKRCRVRGGTEPQRLISQAPHRHEQFKVSVRRNSCLVADARKRPEWTALTSGMGHCSVQMVTLDQVR